MIKIERRETEKTRKAVIALDEARRNDTPYNTLEVNDALYEIFYNKCYICENKHGSSYQIEHLIPHKKNKDLKYDWNNLFLACAHCNNVKLGKYDSILDCTKESVDEVIAFRKIGYFGKEERLEFLALDNREETKTTVALLENVYYGETPQKKFEAKILRKSLREEISRFKGLVREFKDAEGEDKVDLELLLARELKSNSEFTAFKRWLVKDNKEYCSELLKYVG